MKRIGVAASKMAKGNIPLYNFYVVVISFLFSLFIFIITGASVILALTVIAYVGSEILTIDFDRNWRFIVAMCMVSLSAVIGLFNLFAITINIKFPKIHERQETN